MEGMNITLPFEIEAEILKRVPEVKSLLRFRSVSKSWKSLIDSPRFIADYHPHKPRRHIFVWYYDFIQHRFVSVIDNDSFAQHKFPLDIPDSVLLDLFTTLASSKGLFCLYRNFPEGIAVLWNPSIRKTVTIDVPNASYVPKASYETVIGFGVSPYSNDPKLLRIQSAVDVSDLKSRRVEIYSLSTGEWKTLSEDLPRSSVVFYDYDHHVAIGNFIFWLAHEMKGMGMKREMIILFDMTSDKFMEICLPDHMTKEGHPYNYFYLHKIRESLAVAVYFFDHSVRRTVYHVWMMEGGVSDSFTKMYSIITPLAADFLLLAFRNNGHAILRMQASGELAVYEPNLDQFTPIEAFRSAYTRYAGSYMETLLLLDH